MATHPNDSSIGTSATCNTVDASLHDRLNLRKSYCHAGAFPRSNTNSARSSRNTAIGIDHSQTQQRMKPATIVQNALQLLTQFCVQFTAFLTNLPASDGVLALYEGPMPATFDLPEFLRCPMTTPPTCNPGRSTRPPWPHGQMCPFCWQCSSMMLYHAGPSPCTRGNVIGQLHNTPAGSLLCSPVRHQ